MRLAWLLLSLAACGSLPDLYTADGARACDPRSRYYEDLDADGAGNDRSVYVGCSAPVDFVEVGGDCDDADPEVIADCDPDDSGA